jgi:hypothetical protein
MGMQRIRLALTRWVGGLLNMAGAPGFVREGTYSSAHGVDVSVRVSALFTVVAVNQFEIFFYRLSGEIDGVSVTASRRYTEVRIPVRVHDSEPSARE